CCIILGADAHTIGFAERQHGRTISTVCSGDKAASGAPLFREAAGSTRMVFPAEIACLLGRRSGGRWIVKPSSTSCLRSGGIGELIREQLSELARADTTEACGSVSRRHGPTRCDWCCLKAPDAVSVPNGVGISAARIQH